MVAFITVDDLTVFEPGLDAVKAQAMIDDAEALAVMVAPCIEDDTFTAQAAVKAILRGAILRWNQAGTGVVTQQTAGPFTQTVSESAHKAVFYPSEITQLQKLCKGSSGRAFEVDPFQGLPVPEFPTTTW